MKVPFLTRASNFINDFFNRSGIHGFSYLGNLIRIHLVERLFWFCLICAGIYFSVNFSLESWDRYLHKSTVVSVQVDHYYWNTSLPSLTVCPMQRLSVEKYREYANRAKLTEAEREEFFPFLESLANSTYFNFQHIKYTENTDAILSKLKIKPPDYLKLIYSLTEDYTRKPGNTEKKIRTINNLDFIRSAQVLTEYGICYSTNNFLTRNLSTLLLMENKIPQDESFMKSSKVHDVRFGNLFDGDMTFSFIGFPSAITVFMHSPYDTMNLARSIGYTTEAYEFEIFSIEIITTENFQTESFVSQRGCRFNTESNLTHFKVYSKNLCQAECRLNLAMQLCGCIPHFYPNRIASPKPVCSYKQLMTCFPDKQELFLELEGVDKTIRCNCEQNCLDSNVVIEKFQHLKDTKTLIGSIGGLIVMKKYPLVRYQREVIFTLTDFFVSIGGTAGFFLGSSVLGLIEIVYFFSLRLFWFVKGSKERENSEGKTEEPKNEGTESGEFKSIA